MNEPRFESEFGTSPTTPAGGAAAAIEAVVTGCPAARLRAASAPALASGQAGPSVPAVPSVPAAPWARAAGDAAGAAGTSGRRSSPCCSKRR